MKQPNRNASPIPDFADSYYSVAHNNVFDIKNRLRVARQIHAVLRHFLQRGNLSKNLSQLTCLDVGCSTGIITHYLAKFFKGVIGVDIDPYAIREALRNHKGKNLTYKINSATNLKYSDNSFHVVVCHQTLTYIDNQKEVISEIFRVLKPGGFCFLSCGNYLFPIEKEYKIPFLHYLPSWLTSKVVLSLGYKKYYLDNLKTYWQYQRLFRGFKVFDYTDKIMKNAKKFRFVQLYKYNPIITLLPFSVISFLKYFFPQFIFVLEKPRLHSLT